MVRSRESVAIGRRIAEARNLRGISQSGLALGIGVSRGAVGQWESGETAPTTENLSAAAKELRVFFDWLATGRGAREFIPKADRPDDRRQIRRVPVLSWVSAGKLADAGSQIPVEDVPLLAVADLGRGDFFALRVKGDSMDRISPDDSVIIVNRSDRSLVPGKPYVFWHVSEGATYKYWQIDPDRLEPASWNAVNKAIFIKRRRDFEVVGRVRRTLLDL